MGGQGTFVDDRIGVHKTLPAGTPDLVKPKLDALRAYQFSLAAPAAGRQLRRRRHAERGQGGVRPALRELPRGRRAHPGRAARAGRDGHGPDVRDRSASKKYRTTPLRGLWQHPPYFHDGSATTLPAVVDHYDQALGLGLSAADKADLIAYLKAI